jgi:molybdopterin-synthase adenylyltransferase
VEHYLSQTNIKAIGIRGQEKIFEAHIALIGLGGLGSPVIQYLAAAGIGNMIIVDDDIVEASNLTRQVIYNHSDIDKAKTDVAEARAKEISPDIKIQKFFKRLNKDNVNDMLNEVSIVIDASDNFQTKFLLNKYCHDNQKILVSGSSIKMQGYLSVYKSGVDKSKPCFACFHEGDNFQSEKSCSNNGALGAVVGAIGSMMAAEVIKEITMLSNSIAGTLLYYNALENRLKTIEMSKREGCFCNVPGYPL